MTLRIGVLDQSPIGRGEDAADAIAHTTALAKRCEELGYHRYWVAEHHASDTLASSSPEILITRLAAETNHMRIGSGGVMLSHYSPFKVAENFRLLEVLYPGRIDLGVGRAPGSDGLTAAALAYGNPLGIEYYPAKVKDLIAFVNGREPLTEAFRNLKATPMTPTAPEVWMLGSSFDSAAYAARFGLAYSHAHFIAPQRPSRRSSNTGASSRRSISPRPIPPSASSPSSPTTRRRPSFSAACVNCNGFAATADSADHRPRWKRPPPIRSPTRNSRGCAASGRGKSSVRPTRSRPASTTLCMSRAPTK